jgi:hypothetical protein
MRTGPLPRRAGVCRQLPRACGRACGARQGEHDLGDAGWPLREVCQGHGPVAAGPGGVARGAWPVVRPAAITRLGPPPSRSALSVAPAGPLALERPRARSQHWAVMMFAGIPLLRRVSRPREHNAARAYAVAGIPSC